MSDKIQNNSNIQQPNNDNNDDTNAKITTVSELFENWFIDYASYVILERAVPHINDGLKPVQRRILHAMKELDDGRYNKVANIIGHTMQYHPHGDASIGDALVQLGQKGLLIDTQGNWGNIYTGDSAAAPRYIEAKLSKFALEVLFNNKTTKWKPSYDGRKKEPVHLPVRFPLLLAQGVEGIAVGLSTKILPHNFNEIIDAAIAYLKNQEFTLYPDFPTGGMIDVSRYNDGLKGGKVKIRAKIEKYEKKSVVITEIPYGETTHSIIDSILYANDKGKLKIKKIEDKTAQDVKIIIHLPSDISQDQAIDALYAFTKCEITISPNACVIDQDKPRFLSISDILKRSVDNTLNLLKQELLIKLKELNEELFFASLEKIFIENRIYLEIEKCETFEQIIHTIDKALEPFKKQLVRDVTTDDIIKLTEIKIKRISKYDARRADQRINQLNKSIEQNKYNLENIVQYTIDHFLILKEKYGKQWIRKTQIRNFDQIEAKRVAVANKKLFVNYKDGFIGTELKGENIKYIADCSDLDDVIVFLKDGTYLITPVSEKTFVGQNIIYANVFKNNDKRTIYNVAYLDGKTGYTYVKRFAVYSILRDKKYNLTQGAPFSKVLYFSANPNGEAEKVIVKLKPKPRLKKRIFEFDFSTLDIKNRNAKGNILTKHQVYKIQLIEKGSSTLGGINVWFDPSTQRLKNTQTQHFVGEFFENDKILVILDDGKYYITDLDFSHYFEGKVKRVEKLNPEKIYSVIYYNGEQGYIYLKRFVFEYTTKITTFIGDNPKAKLIDITDHPAPLVKIVFGGKDAKRPTEIITAQDHVKVKSIDAKGKRLSSYQIKDAKFIIPQQQNQNDNVPFEVLMPNDSKLDL